MFMPQAMVAERFVVHIDAETITLTKTAYDSLKYRLWPYLE